MGRLTLSLSTTPTWVVVSNLIRPVTPDEHLHVSPCYGLSEEQNLHEICNRYRPMTIVYHFAWGLNSGSDALIALMTFDYMPNTRV